MQPLTELRSKHIRELLNNPRARRGDSEFVIEGPHLIEAALEKAPKLILYLAVTEKAIERHPELLERAEALGLSCCAVSPKHAGRITNATEPQGWFAVLRMPRPVELRGNVVIALDGLQDPGNVGTIIRTAAWFGVETILLGNSTADPFAPKVVRSTQGAIFDVSLETGGNLVKRLSDLRTSGWEIVATTLDPAATSIFETTFPNRCILLFGKEARGISPELLEISNSRLVIPKFGSGESLNVAASAAIVLAELRRRGQGL
jgi:RNA methyltransferase, TrmH family